jgi:hypothetical protein
LRAQTFFTLIGDKGISDEEFEGCDLSSLSSDADEKEAIQNETTNSDSVIDPNKQSEPEI